MARSIRIYDAQWSFMEEPSEHLEHRLYTVGLVVMWGDDGSITLEGGYQEHPPAVLEMLAEIAPLSEAMSWVLWWPADSQHDVRLSLVVDAELRELALPRPPARSDELRAAVGWDRRRRGKGNDAGGSDAPTGAK